MAEGSPYTTTSTLPSTRFRAYPLSFSATACSRAEARKNTPCTVPLTTNRAAFMSFPLGNGLVEFRRRDAADKTLGDRAVRSDQIGGRQALGRLEVFRRRQDIHLRNRIDDLVLTQERLDLLDVRILEGQADRRDVLVGLHEVRDVRHFLDAGHAPGCPVVDHHPLATLRGEVERLAVDRGDL